MFRALIGLLVTVGGFLATTIDSVALASVRTAVLELIMLGRIPLTDVFIPFDLLLIFSVGLTTYWLIKKMLLIAREVIQRFSWDANYYNQISI